MKKTPVASCEGKKSRPKAKLNIPDLEHSKPRSYAASVPRTPGVGNGWLIGVRGRGGRWGRVTLAGVRQEQSPRTRQK
jgi:hypothetical protein